MPNSALKYVLESLVPYTEANLKLSFSPNTFFNDLERIEWQRRINRQKATKYRQYRKQTIRKAFYRARKQNYITYENNAPRLTSRGRRAIKPYRPKYLGAKAFIIVSFDIPEKQRNKRNTLRSLLKELDFRQVQQSVWKSQYDHIELLQHEIKRLELKNFVNIYESMRIDN